MKAFKAYADVGYVTGTTPITQVIPGGKHTGDDRAKRVPTAFTFLLHQGG